MLRYLMIPIIVDLIFLSGCQTSQPVLDSTLDPELGQAVRHNVMAMAIVPTEAERNNTFIPADREHRARAIKAYREGTTPDPEPMTTRGSN